MRTYGRVTNSNATLYPTGFQWVEVDTDANGYNDEVYLTTLCQCLQLSLNESPFWATYGIPAQQSVIQQVAPDYNVALMQQAFSPYFVALGVARVSSATQPTYTITAITHQGATLTASVAQ
jgi:hypothetical protein